MSFKEDEFYKNTIATVNSRINRILFAAVVVPVAFLVFTWLDIWVVPYDYSIFLTVYTLQMALLQFVLNHFSKKRIMQYISMYVGMIAIIGFVTILGEKNVVIITISFAFPPFISCLYYNRRFTNIISLLNYIFIIANQYVKIVVYNNMSGDYMGYSPDALSHFISRMIGITIEYIFVVLVCYRMNERTYTTLNNLIKVNEDHNKAMKSLHDRNQYIIKINKEIESKNADLQNTQFRIIEFISECMESHNVYSGSHLLHTKKFVEIICNELRHEGYYLEDLTDQNIALFINAAYLHDIGKLHVPDSILNKKGKYTPEEYEVMKCHPEEGLKLLEYLPKIGDGTFNEIAKQMAYCHQEKWDGSGYPNGLSGIEIPLCARILTAADVLDALISKRLYKEEMTVAQAMEEFRRCSGSHFEPCIAQAVINSQLVIDAVKKQFVQQEGYSNTEELGMEESGTEELGTSDKK
ncbi:MAG: HD domain-containing protein [Treponema sp.]|nr:HD domain-containing protein [Treponema sp.]